MLFPENLLYTASHEWVKIEGDEAVIGLTAFAQDKLGDITYVDLPKVGRKLEANKEFGSIESVKAASELYSPVDGVVIAVNEELEATPEKVNASPYEAGWMLRVKLAGQSKTLLSAAKYAATLD
jgi:glycine cleavage system H protein